MNYHRKLLFNALFFNLSLLLLLCFSISATGQKAIPDSTRFAIGNQINLTLEFPYNPGQEVKWPVIGDTITKSIEVLAKSKIDTIQPEGSDKKVLRQIIGITSFDTGFIALPPFTFTVVNGGAQSANHLTEPILFEVIKTQVDPAADIKDIKPLLEAPLTFAEVLPWLIGVIVLAALIYLAYRYFKNRKKVPEIKAVPKIKIPAWQTALTKLEKLKAAQLWQKGDVKEYYTQLTDILREYFEARYAITASEMTSSEILYAVEPHISNEELKKKLRDLLFWADMAKFAKAQPGTYENEQSFAHGIDIVNNTKPVNGENNNQVN